MLLAVNVSLELILVLVKVLVDDLFDDVINFVDLTLRVAAIVRQVSVFIFFRYVLRTLNGIIPVTGLSSSFLLTNIAFVREMISF